MTLFILIIIMIVLYLLTTYFMFSLISKKSKTNFLPMSKGVAKSVEPYREIIINGKEWVAEKIKNNQLKDVYIYSRDNLKLHAVLIENPNEKGILLEIHGYRSTAENDLYTSCYEYYNMGYSLLIPDNRTCNKSEGKYITFGLKESDDIICWIEYLNKAFPKQSIILAGISMGATSVLMSLKNLKTEMNVKCAIADSGYVSAYSEVLHCIKHYFHINGKLFISMIDIWCKLFAKFSLKECNTLVSLDKTNIPILFIHGLEDEFVPPDNSKTNYQHYHGQKQLALFEKADHGLSYLVDSKRYIQYIKNFVRIIFK